MKKNIARIFTLLAVVMVMSITVLEINAEARAGGGRSSGFRGSRSYSQPSRPYSQPSPSRQQYNSASTPNTFQQPQSGGFLRSMAGGIVGGMLGGMLFRSLGFAGTGGMGGGGIGLLEILLLAGIGFMIHRFIRKKREASLATPYGQAGYQSATMSSFPSGFNSGLPEANPVDSGIANIRSMDATFNEQLFKDSVMDIFFRIQGAWMNRDLAPVSNLLTQEMKGVFQEEVTRLLRDKQINRLENIAVRSVEITEAWQESGQDFITASIYANLLDYTTDDSTGAVISGSRTEPVKFEEYWTFTRAVGNNAWCLSAINQN